MEKKKLKEYVSGALKIAGITINGENPYDIRIKNDDFYQRVLAEGDLGLGESYMDRWWDCKAVDEFIERILRSRLTDYVKHNWSLMWYGLKSRLFNMQTVSRAFQIGESHYDLGNDLFKAMLDERMVYTCGYWKKTDNLADAQVAKLDLICRKIALEPGMTVLDIGCGFGGFAQYAAENYGAHVTGITVSKNQAELARENCRALPVEIRLEDYRKTSGRFDRVISVGTFEHMGYKNYRTYMRKVHDLLGDDGISLLHTIGGNFSSTATNAWMNRYIFPNGMIPSITQIGKAMENLFVMEDWHNFGEYYDRTLMSWYRNFKESWPKLKKMGKQYNERFYRMWEFYLLSCAGAFRARKLQLWQIVMTKTGTPQPDCRIS